MAPRESLIAARKEAGLSRIALAELLGFNRTHVHHVEMGRRNPSVALMRRWAMRSQAKFSDLDRRGHRAHEPAGQGALVRQDEARGMSQAALQHRPVRAPA